MSKKRIAKETQSLADYDWLMTNNGWKLHAPKKWNPEADETWGYGTTLCGRKGLLFIPGMFSRTSLERCKLCCKREGYPEGKGSPKNDPLIRQMRGWGK